MTDHTAAFIADANRNQPVRRASDTLAPVTEPAASVTIGEAFKQVGGWMNGGELGYPSFGSFMALQAYTVKMQNNAVAIALASRPAAHVIAPPGWPLDPTPEMQQAGASAIRFDTTIINKLWTANAVYRAMRAAVQAQAGDAQGGGDG